MGADLLEVGRITKAHGLRGQVLVQFLSDREERRRPGAELSTAAHGRLTITAASAHQNRWLVTFDGVTDRNAAEALRGVLLYAEPLDSDGDDDVFVHEVAGKRLVEVDGTDRGEVVALEANPAADLLVLDDDRVVPLTFVVEITDSSVVVDVPDGLFDL